MSKLTIDGFLLCVVACAGCTSESTSPGGAVTPTNMFAGTWACSDALSVTITSPPGVPVQNSTTLSTLDITANNDVLAAKTRNDAGPGCEIAFTSKDSTATLNDGQTCTTSTGLMLAYKSGSATASASTLNSTFDFDATGTITIDTMMVPATATGTQTSTCSRLSAPPPTTTGGKTTTTGW